MKSDINRLMRERDLDAFIVFGGEEFNSARYYLSNGAKITHGTILKARDGEMLLVCGGIEFAEAQKSGLPVKTSAELGYNDRLKQSENSATEATALFFGDLLREIGLRSGRVGLYGAWQVNKTIALYQLLAAQSQYEFVAEGSPTVIETAMLTKDDEEIARMKSVARRCNEVMQAVWDFIASLRRSGDLLIDAAGRRATIGVVKDLARRELMARGLEDTGMIFAQGADGGSPHSRGEADMPLQIGQAIVFDLFPRELGGGYHHDMTRTWCIGFAPPAVQAAYDTVMDAFDIAVETYGLDKPTHIMQEAVQDHFEARGHATSRSAPKTLCGYMHSLGHGVGIDIHERPSISHLARKDTFQIGNVFSIEPGLYYPELGFGMRVEDLFVIDSAGELVSLTTFRKDLVIPLRDEA
ncbi:MAG: M24 family metallopeptidase [Chloroflexi bacterium]|nr:M24 family metallopeptidase [Chloroflexota bacterium]MCY4247643.1 M24 family metallopeptidase [Chloroflexota bacterium]